MKATNSSSKSLPWIIYTATLVGGLGIIIMTILWHLTGLYLSPSKDLLNASVSAFGISAVLCALTFEIASKKEDDSKKDIYLIGLYFLGSAMFMIPAVFMTYFHLNWVLKDTDSLTVYFGIEALIVIVEVGFYLMATSAFLIAFYKLTHFISKELFER